MACYYCDEKFTIANFEVPSTTFNRKYIQADDENLSVFGIKIHHLKGPFRDTNEPDLHSKKILVPDSNFSIFQSVLKFRGIILATKAVEI